MTDLQFLTEWGDVLPLSGDGLEAILEGEFEPWRVRWIGPDRGALFVRLGDGAVELQPLGDSYVLPARRRKKGKTDALNVKFAGLVELFADKDCECPLRPWLRVEPANLSPAAFRSLVWDLRALALDLSVYLAPTSARTQVAHVDGGASLFASWIVASKAAEVCLATYERQLPIVQRRPARVLRSRIRLTDNERAIRLGHAQHVSRWPEGQRRIPVPMREYDVDTPEHRFVTATLHELCRDGEALAALMSARLADMARSEAEAGVARRHFGPTVARGRTLATVQSIEEAHRLAESLRSQAQRLRAYLTDRLHSPADTTVRTNRLRMSPQYRPILDAWETFRQSTPISAEHTSITTRIDERSIAPSAALYERWATWRIYAGLIAVGFRPPPGEPSLMDVVEIEDGAIDYLAGDKTPLRLLKECHGREVNLVLRHEPTVDIDGAMRRPDLVVSAQSAYTSETWVFDHKYKDYDLPAPSYDRDKEEELGSHFLADLVGVAERRYRRGMKAAVGGIVHPDLDPRYAFWDADRTDRHPELRAPTPHAHISVPLAPGPQGNENFTKLLRLLLGFRLQLAETCWRCGTDCFRQDVPNSQGDGYSCVSCGAFWIVHWCRSGHKPILKFGKASFHAVEPNDPYNVHCPWCGDYFRGLRSVTPLGRPGRGGIDEPF